LLRGTSTAADLLRLIISALVCTACCYFISVSVATVLDEVWQIYGSFLLIGFSWALARFALPSSANVFGYVSGASPLLTHTFPWPAIAVSLSFSVLLFFISLKVVQGRY
jgi:hypothetical protein